MPTAAPTLDPGVLSHAAEVIKCLGHPLRLQLLDALESGEKTVTDLHLRTGATQAMVSQQLGILRGRGIVGARRAGPFVFYRITEPKVYRVLACIRECDMRPAGGAAGHSSGRNHQKRTQR
ncbi:MAG TPA: metalloregulator ArsR/SmtB family transcription factor [Gemmatimonadales bacterium]|nr:metalloregulator ArsR/SmtB family transcription factor [Gemmatimonadales bacterium]